MVRDKKDGMPKDNDEIEDGDVQGMNNQNVQESLEEVIFGSEAVNNPDGEDVFEEVRQASEADSGYMKDAEPQLWADMEDDLPLLVPKESDIEGCEEDAEIGEPELKRTRASSRMFKETSSSSLLAASTLATGRREERERASLPRKRGRRCVGWPRRTRSCRI